MTVTIWLMKNLLKFGLISLIFNNLKLFIYSSMVIFFIAFGLLISQAPDLPPSIEEVMAEVDNNLITECKDKLYLVAISDKL